MVPAARGVSVVVVPSFVAVATLWTVVPAAVELMVAVMVKIAPLAPTARSLQVAVIVGAPVTLTEALKVLGLAAAADTKVKPLGKVSEIVPGFHGLSPVLVALMV